MPYKMQSLDVSHAVVAKKNNLDDELDEISGLRRIEQIEREAYEKGFNAGQSAGFEIGQQNALLLMQRLEKAIADLAQMRQNKLKELEKQVVELSFAIAKGIIIKELSINPDIITDIAKEALTRLQKTGQVVIRIHPSLNEIFQKNKPQLLNVYPDIIFELDTKAPLYGAEVIGPEESVMTDLQEQFRNILEDMGMRIARD
jgi:flagellar biosynthesis/type III secretory pathway protein FliH